MRVLSIHKGQDTAGIGWLLAQAFRGHPTISLRSAVRRSNYIAYPHDLDWSRAQVAWAAADVAHLHNTLATWQLMGGRKPFVLHHHGTYYRQNAEVLNREVADRGGRAVAATLDLLDLDDDLTWCPAPFDLDWLAGFRQPRRGRLRVGHAPTDRSLKSTAAFLEACRKLGVDPVLIEGQSWQECLRLKGTCDVLYDQVRLGYGHNAVEAWAMGIPVIAGAPLPTLNRMQQTFGGLPFFPAIEFTIGDAIEALMQPEIRHEWADAGQRHARRWHDGRETVDRLGRLYTEVLAAH